MLALDRNQPLDQSRRHVGVFYCSQVPLLQTTLIRDSGHGLRVTHADMLEGPPDTGSISVESGE